MNEAEITKPAPIQSTFDESGESFFYRITQVEGVKIAALGLIVGILVPLLSFLATQYFIQPVFCHATNTYGVCNNAGLTAYYISTVLISALATIILVNWQVFRPLLIAVAAAAALWGLQQAIGELARQSWLEYGLLSAITFMFTYLLFYWLMRVRSFVASVLLSVLAVVLLRWLLLA